MEQAQQVEQSAVVMQQPLAETTVSFLRLSDYPGVELRQVQNPGPSWQNYSSGYEFITSNSWCGDIWHQRAVEHLDPWSILCAGPGSALLLRESKRLGSLVILTIDADLFDAMVTAKGHCPKALRLRSLCPRSPRVSVALRQLGDALLSKSATFLDEALRNFVDVVLVEMLREDAPVSSAQHAVVAERVLQRLSEDASTNVDLSTLAQDVGMSRFQTLRAFKRRYGLPPHSYLLSMRVGLAQKALRHGESPARVAASHGFVDQSHMTRHFKRLLGVTPGEYVRATR